MTRGLSRSPVAREASHRSTEADLRFYAPCAARASRHHIGRDSGSPGRHQRRFAAARSEGEDEPNLASPASAVLRFRRSFRCLPTPTTPDITVVASCASEPTPLIVPRVLASTASETEIVYLRAQDGRKERWTLEYWLLVCSVRWGREALQDVVAQVGKLDARARRRARALADRLTGRRLQPSLFEPPDTDYAPVEQIEMKDIKLERSRRCGDVIRVRCVVRPNAAHARLLDRLGLEYRHGSTSRRPSTYQRLVPINRRKSLAGQR
jgi:hypothetical protein